MVSALWFSATIKPIEIVSLVRFVVHSSQRCSRHCPSSANAKETISGICMHTGQDLSGSPIPATLSAHIFEASWSLLAACHAIRLGGSAVFLR